MIVTHESNRCHDIVSIMEVTQWWEKNHIDLRVSLILHSKLFKG